VACVFQAENTDVARVFQKTICISTKGGIVVLAKVQYWPVLCPKDWSLPSSTLSSWWTR